MRKTAAILLTLMLLLGCLSAHAQSVTPEGLAGTWVGTGAPEGNGDPISLTLTVAGDGTGSYTFTQGNYTESYPFTLAAEAGAFNVSIPQDNELKITACEGVYTLQGETLALHITTTFEGGRQFAYSVTCEKAAQNSPAALAHLQWQGIGLSIVLVTEDETLIGISPSMISGVNSGERLIKLLFLPQDAPIAYDAVSNFGHTATLIDQEGKAYIACAGTNVRIEGDSIADQPVFGLLFAVPETVALDTLCFAVDGVEGTTPLSRYGESTYEALLETLDN